MAKRMRNKLRMNKKVDDKATESRIRFFNDGSAQLDIKAIYNHPNFDKLMSDVEELRKLVQKRRNKSADGLKE